MNRKLARLGKNDLEKASRPGGSNGAALTAQGKNILSLP